MVTQVNYKIVVNDKDVTASIRPYLHSINITDNHNEQADCLTLVIASKFKRPVYQDKIKIYFGYKELTYLGLFYVQSTSLRNNRELTINATGVDYQATLKERRIISYEDTQLNTVLQEVAQRHGLEQRIDVEQTAVTHFDQYYESDLAFLNRLAKAHNAIFNIKNNTLYFVQNEKLPPPINVDITNCLDSEITQSSTSCYSCAKAIYQDTKQNIMITKQVGDGTPVLVIQGCWQSENEALEAAEKALERANAAQASGRVSFKGQVIFAGGLIDIANGQYQITKVTHSVQPAWVTEVEFQSLTKI